MDERYAAPQAADGPERTSKGSRSGRVFEYFVQPTGARLPALGCTAALVSAAVAALLGLLNLADYALPAAALTFAALWWRNRRLVARPQATLSIEGARLLVANRYSREILDVPLSDLLDVELDTKTIQRVQDNLSADVLPHFRLLHGQVGSATDVSRIVLVTSKLELPLTEEHVSSSYTTESFGHLRRFLRNHGWLPKDERA
ncbi:MAG: hypothetical protein ABW061_06945 [Polyangiaceae bacterium]